MRTKIKYSLLAFSLVSIVAACTDSKQYETSFCALVDISGTYASQKSSVVKIIKAGILPEMIPGDSLYFITIDSNSYTKDNLVTKLLKLFPTNYSEWVDIRTICCPKPDSIKQMRV